MSRIELTYAGRPGVDPNEPGAHIPGVPASDLILDDSPGSEEEYGARVRADTQYQPPVLITRRIIERLITWHAFEDTEGVALAERLAVDLTASGLYTTTAALAAGAPRFTDGREEVVAAVTRSTATTASSSDDSGGLEPPGDD